MIKLADGDGPLHGVGCGSGYGDNEGDGYGCGSYGSTCVVGYGNISGYGYGWGQLPQPSILPGNRYLVVYREYPKNLVLKQVGPVPKSRRRKLLDRLWNR